MTNHLGRYIEAERCRQGIGRGELARRLGARTPRQMTRLANRLVRLEREGVDARGLLDDVVRVLGLDAIEIQRLAAEDERERLETFQRWLEEPVRPVLYERVIPGVVLRVRVPDAYAQASRDVLEEYAGRFRHTDTPQGLPAPQQPVFELVRGGRDARRAIGRGAW